MSITPPEIEAQTFPIVFRGYKVEAVDAFLDRLQTDLAEMLAARAGDPTIARAAAAVDEGPKSRAAASTPDAGPVADEPGHAARALRILARAEEMAEQIVADASAEADEIRDRALVEAEDIIAAAKVESGRIEAELQRRRQREVGSLLVQAQQLRAEIDRLTGLEHQYHDALQALLSEQQQLLERRIPALDAALAGAPTTTEDLRTAA